MVVGGRIITYYNPQTQPAGPRCYFPWYWLIESLDPYPYAPCMEYLPNMSIHVAKFSSHMENLDYNSL